jgi:hypothetical protein
MAVPTSGPRRDRDEASGHRTTILRSTQLRSIMCGRAMSTAVTPRDHEVSLEY